MIKNIKWLFLASLAFVACNDDDETTQTDDTPVVAGTANFTKYVALGNSLTAGFSDGALFKAGQQNSFTNILAQQFALVGGGEFKIPYMNDNIGGFSLSGAQVPQFPTRLIFNGSSPVNLPATSTTVLGASIAASGPYNNMGVPGAKSFHLVANGYGTLNPYFGRFATSATTSVLADAMAQQPTFFSLWIGNNDVLAYAMSGGTGTNQNGNLNPSTYGINDITDPTVFTNTYNGLVNTLTSNGAKGVVANIPNVANVPFFTTIPYNPVPLDATTAAQLNAQLIAPVKQVLTALGQGDRIVTLVAGNNPLLIKDESITDLSAQLTAALTPMVGATQAAYLGQVYGQARHAKNTDLVLLTTKSVIGATNAAAPAPFNVWGVTSPLQDQHVLIPTEIAEIASATASFNASIKAAAESKGLAFVDVYAVMQQLANGGVRFDNFHMTAAFVQGGAFSLDGIHLTARANAYIANQFAAAINAKYGSTFKGVKAQDYSMSYPASL